ncbi:MAG: hypothetical protein K0Q94_2241 [Paenibacillus sp.]|jgi:hypothetical protein|uniref:hypothetical protein n=1 Tax=Paenibacillus sp. GCM10012303 TaxID=3317340 RepID=UPI0029EA1EE0|nr:hypothetical protein [Paenibacillus sp.]
MTRKQWDLTGEIGDFDYAEAGARPGTWAGREATYLEGFHTIPVLLRDEISFDSYRIEAEVASPGPYGFIGLAFGARDIGNYELVYISPGQETSPGDIQYDPIMNGSSTWQIYQGPAYQAFAPFPAGEWIRFALEVQPHGVSVYVNETDSPQLVITNLQHGRAAGRVGFWGNFPGYIRNFTVEEIRLQPLARTETDIGRLAGDSYITEWSVSEPYLPPADGDGTYEGAWTTHRVEENGCLNLNRLYAAGEKGTAVQAKCSFTLPEAAESVLSFGFSDGVRLWVNDALVYEGVSLWDPPGSDGRIRADQTVPVKWRAGVNTVRTEVTNQECMFGWGLAVKTGLPPVRFTP